MIVTIIAIVVATLSLLANAALAHHLGMQRHATGAAVASYREANGSLRRIGDPDRVWEARNRAATARNHGITIR